ncbi:glycosyltransferase family 9 protein [candidate division KSB1 bacterium]|nr:glycosyltransferase family 9 protein [candidate division KSB1 bacterium]
MIIKNVKNILVIKLRAVGDVLLSTIVLENLRSAFPDARIDFLTEKAGSQIVAGNPFLNDVIILDRPKNLNLSWYGRLKYHVQFLYQIRRRKYDIVFDFFGNPRSAILSVISGAPKRVGYNYRIRQLAYNNVVRTRASHIHEAPWHLDALTALNIPVISKELSFFIDPQSKQFADEFWKEQGLDGKRVLALNFSGGWPAKRWPLERFAELSERIVAKYQTQVLLLWGPGEKDDALRLQALSKVKTMLIPETDLKQLGAILAKTDLMVSTDSGPMHIAAAMSTPCVAIYGPTNYKLQGPYGDIHQIVYKDNLDCLCCNRLDCDTLSCMNALSVDAVFSAVEKCIYKNNLFE